MQFSSAAGLPRVPHPVHMSAMSWTQPVMTCFEAVRRELTYFCGEQEKEWATMRLAGAGTARAVLEDLAELGGSGNRLKILVLAGKGHNSGDAMLAAAEIMKQREGSQVAVLMAQPFAQLKPLAAKARQILGESAYQRVRWILNSQGERDDLARERFDICLDGLLGNNFRPPIRPDMQGLIEWVNAHPSIRLRAACDLPTGVGDQPGTVRFRADFTYAAGIMKKPLLEAVNRQFVGRLRLLDLGFFNENDKSTQIWREDADKEVLLGKVLERLRHPRDPWTDKRHYGHVLVIGGSRNMPGAVLLNTLGAIRGGAGLVTTVAPGPVGLNLAGACPEAMWPAYPETHDGRLSPNGWNNLLAHLGKADAIVAGSGTVPDTDSLMLFARLVAETKAPLVLDGGALHPSVVNEIKNRPADAGPVVITPHSGEYIRLSAQPEENPADFVIKDWAKPRKVILVLKGACTRITDGKRMIQNFRGSPALARAGSGDVLAGILGAALAEMRVRKPQSTVDDALEAVSRSVYWHALAGEVLARHKGQSAARTLDLVDSLPEALEFDPEVAVVEQGPTEGVTRPPMMPSSPAATPAASPAAGVAGVRPNPYNPYQSRQIGPPK